MLKTLVQVPVLSEIQVQDTRRLYDRMKGWDYSAIIETAMRECGVKKKHRAEELLDGFLQWFSLIPLVDSNQPLQMLRSVDRIWHAFILNTAFYRNFCKEFTGGFVDHDPLDVTANSAEDKRHYADNTLLKLQAVFGNYVTPDLANLQEDCTCCVGCG